MLSILMHGLVFLQAVFFRIPSFFWQLLRGAAWPTGQAAPDTPSPPYALFLSFIEWDRAWQRPQHLCVHLADQMEVLCCAPMRAHNAGLRALRLFVSPMRKINEHLIVCEPLLLPFENRFRLIRWLNHLILYQHLRHVILERGQVPSVLLTNSPFFSETFTWLPASLRVYDIMDALTRFPWAPGDAEEQELLTLEQADLITTGTLSLLRAKQQEYPHLADRIHYVACGVDAEHFSQASNQSLQPPVELAHLPRPILGYFGAINERLDTDLIAGLAERMPEASLVLIGPIYGRFPDFQGHSNIRLLGPRPYADLPRYLAAFDCALVPYRLTQGIEFVQPVKVLEYLAGGKPVVSTHIPDVAELYGSLVHLADTPQAFAEAVKRALQESPARSGNYRTAACGRCWKTMTQEFLTLFEKTETDKRRAPCRIAHFLHGAHLGGAEELVGQICQALPADQCQAQVVCLTHGDRVQQRFATRGLSPHIVPMRGKLDFTILIRLARLLRRQRIALTHSHTGRTHLLARLLWRLAGIPCVATVHTHVARDLNDPAQTSNRLNAWIDRRTRHWSWKILCVSKRNYEEVAQESLSPDRIVHVPNGIPIPAARPLLTHEEKQALLGTLGIEPEPDGIIGMVASLRPRKGPETLLCAMRLVLDAHPQAILLLIGSAEFVQSRDYLGDLKKLAQELGIQDRVHFLGHRDDVDYLLPLLDIATLPSLFGEGLPLAVLEAMAAGKPVVATRTEGNDEAVVDGETGLLVPSGNAPALAQALLRLLEHPDEARTMGLAGNARARQHFSLEMMVKRHTEIYTALCRAVYR